ncbi:MAG: hypothetical protein ABL949_11755, partial [Fimbriimonadaceae bacterium]
NKAGSLNGLMLMGEREKSSVRSAFEYQDTPGETPTGRSKFIIQNLNAKLNGGTIEANYQDISSNFASFGAVASAGYDQAYVDQLAKEKGLKRFGFAVKNVKVGNTLVSNGIRQVRDGDASLQWKEFGFQSGPLKFNFNSQKVDSNFTRFQDLAEGNRDQLAREAGLSRQSMLASLGGFSYSHDQVEDLEHNGIYRKNIGFTSKAFDLGFKEQQIDSGFRRFDSLFEQEKGQWGRESGIKRRDLMLNAAIMGKDKTPLFAHHEMSNGTGKFTSNDLSLMGKSWSLEHAQRGSDPNFNGMGSMTETEMDQNIKAIATMYGPQLQTRPQDRGAFLQGVGLQREFTKIGAKPFSNWNAELQHLTLGGTSDNIHWDRLLLANKNVEIKASKLSYGKQFSEQAKQMEFERQTLGTVAGLERSDFGMKIMAGKGKNFGYSHTDAKTDEGGMNRDSVSFSDPKIDVSATVRNVDKSFSQVGGLVDPEKDLLNALRGFSQKDAKLKWQLLPGLSLDGFLFDANNTDLDQSNRIQNFSFNWKPDSKTQIEGLSQSQKFQDPIQVLFANLTRRISITRNFGKLGTLQYMNETVNFDGIQTTSPDTKKQYFAYETKINAKTSVRTEQTRTQIEGGDKEDISTNTISTEITKSAGVSVSDVHVDRKGEDRDERRRNYGFWFDFGKGFKLTYGYNRQMNGLNGLLNSNVTLTPGTLGWLQLQNASYAENRWDAQNAQGLSNIAFQSAKPLNLGLIQDFKFNFSLDTATDRTNWVRENKFGGVSGRVGSNVFSLDYRTQMHASGYRGIDRSFKFATDQSDKAPLKAHFNYTARQLPQDKLVMIRDIGVSYKHKNFEVGHQLLTNPQIAQPIPDLPMFQMTDPWRVNKWSLGWNMSSANSLAATWEERINDQTAESSRLAGITLDLFKTSGSPLQLFYGVEQRWGNTPRQTGHRFSIRYDQRPGPNQILSIYAGNVSYEHNIAPGFHRNNMTLSVNYQLKF